MIYFLEIVIVDIKILWFIHNRPIVHDKIFMIKLISNWWRGWSANESSHAVTSNEESHMAASEEKRPIWKVFY